MQQNDSHSLPTEKNWDFFWKTQSSSTVQKPSWSKRRMMALIEKYIQPNMKALEAGCGGGFFSNYFIEKGCETTALDYSESALEHAKKTTGGKAKLYLKADLLSDSFGQEFKESFDLIFSDGLLEHFVEQDQQKIISNFYKVLKPEGVVLTFVPNKWSPWQIIRPYMMPGIFEKPFRIDSLKKLHSKFSIQECGGINVLPIGPSPEILGSQFGMLLYCFGRRAQS